MQDSVKSIYVKGLVAFFSSDGEPNNYVVGNTPSECYKAISKVMEISVEEVLDEVTVHFEDLRAEYVFRTKGTITDWSDPYMKRGGK